MKTDVTNQVEYKPSKIGLIPSEWKLVPLESVSDKIMVGIASSATQAYRETGVPLFRNQNIKESGLDDSDLLFIEEAYEKSHRNKRLKSGDVLTVRTGYPGISAVVPKKYEGAQCFTSLITRPNKDLISSEWLALYINSPIGKKLIQGAEAGGAQKNVNAGVLSKLLIPNIPLPEQRKIAEILSTWDEAIENLEKLIAAKEKLKKGLMQQLLTGKKRLPGFVGEWETMALSKIIKESRVKSLEANVDKRISVRLHLGGVEKREVRGTEAEGSTAYFTRYAGQFIYGKQNLHKGAIGLIPDSLDGFESTQDLPCFDFDNRIVDSIWFIEFFSRESFYSRLEGISTGTGSKRIHPKDLLRLKLQIPSLDEQKAISKVLMTMNQDIKLNNAKLDLLTKQKKGLMQQLLTGKTRVKV